MKDKNVDFENGIQVFTNISFPGFSNTKDHVFYGAWHIAEAIAEVMVDLNKRPSSEMIAIRDKILKKSAEITRDLDALEEDKKVAEKLKQEYEERISKIKASESASIEV